MDAAEETPSKPTAQNPTTEMCQTVFHETPPLPLQASKRTYKKKSIVWDHFTKIVGGDPAKPRAACNYCGADYACDPKINGTRSMLTHIESQCKKYPYRKDVKTQKTLSFQPKKESQEGESVNNLVAASFSMEACRKALAEMIIIDELPFRFVEGEGFRRFCNVMQPKFVNVPSHTLVAKDCLRVYMEEKKKLMSVLKGQRICLTTDTWTSLQNLNYMCLTAHFIDSDWKLHKRILNFCQVPNHKGETIGKAIEMCLLEWGIDGIFTITVDNASSNSGAIQYLRRKTKSWKGTILEHEFIHMRCCAHILKLIVCEGLKDMDNSIVKVRNVVRYVKSSTSRLAKFKKCVEEEKIGCKSFLCLDVPTRWNSTYMMLESADKYQKAFQRLEEDDSHYLYYFREEEEEEEPNMDGNEDVGGKEKGKGKRGRKILGPPDSDDFANVRMFVKFLKLFHDATLHFSGSLHVTSNVFFIEIFLIQNKLHQLCQNEDFLLSSMAKSMRTKYDKYWGNIDKINMLLYVAVVLDPRYKLKYVKFCFEQLYEVGMAKELTRKVKDVLTHLYEWYVANDSSSSVQAFNASQTVEGMNVDEDEQDAHAILASQFKRHLKEEDSIGKSEVKRFLVESCEDNSAKFDILGWWKNNSTKYRILSQIARDVLAIPVSTVVSESAFNTGGRVLDPFRSSLSPSMVEALICAQNWLQSSSSPISLRDAMDEVEQYEKIELEFMGPSSS